MRNNMKLRLCTKSLCMLKDFVLFSEISTEISHKISIARYK